MPLSQQARNLLNATVVVLIILIAAYVAYQHYTTKVSIVMVAAASNGVVTVMGSTMSGDPSKWVGKMIRVHTTSMGNIRSKIVAVSGMPNALTIVTAPGAYTGHSLYAPVKTDYAEVSTFPSL